MDGTYHGTEGKYPLKYDDENLSCPYIMQEIDRVTNGEAIITTDVGQHQMWAAQYYHYTKPVPSCLPED